MIDIIYESPAMNSVFEIGLWFLGKYQHRAYEADVQTVARQLRKQGVPLRIAMLILVGIEPRLLP